MRRCIQQPAEGARLSGRPIFEPASCAGWDLSDFSDLPTRGALIPYPAGSAETLDETTGVEHTQYTRKKLRTGAAPRHGHTTAFRSTCVLRLGHVHEKTLLSARVPRSSAAIVQSVRVPSGLPVLLGQ